MAVIGSKGHPVIAHRPLDHGLLRFNELSTEVGPSTNTVLPDGRLKSTPGERGV